MIKRLTVKELKEKLKDVPDYVEIIVVGEKPDPYKIVEKITFELFETLDDYIAGDKFFIEAKKGELYEEEDEEK